MRDRGKSTDLDETPLRSEDSWTTAYDWAGFAETYVHFKRGTQATTAGDRLLWAILNRPFYTRVTK